MNVPSRFILVISTLFSLAVMADNSTPEVAATSLQAPAIELKPLLGVVSEDTTAVEKLDDRTCNTYSSAGRPLKIGSLVAVFGLMDCRTVYGNSTVPFYEVMIAGKSHYIAQGSLALNEKKLTALKGIPSERKAEFSDLAKSVSLVLRKDELERLVAMLDKSKKAGLAILRSSITDVSEYTEGTSFSVQVMNPTNKTIKYIWFTVIGFNAVKDPVRDRLKGGPALTVKAVGPIEKDESGTYEWKYMWHTDLVERFRITKIKVQYMDNSTRVIANPGSIIFSSELVQILEEPA